MLVCSTFNNEGLRVDTERWECLLLTAAETWNPLPVTILLSLSFLIKVTETQLELSGKLIKVFQ